MEVAGRKGSPISDIYCQPCMADSISVKAKGFCEECYEFICKSCIKAHKKLSWTKSHVIKSKDKIPAFMVVSSPCTEPCNVHKKEHIKWYCQGHDRVGCNSCIKDEHSACNVKLVTYVSRNYEDSDQFDGIKQRITYMRNNLSSSKEKVKYSLKIAEEMKNEVIREIKVFRKEVDCYLDNIELDLIRKVDEMNGNIVSTQKELRDKCEALNDELKEFQSKLDNCKGNVNNLFVTSKLIIRKLQNCLEKDDDITLKNKIHILKFTPSDDICQLKLNKVSLGNIRAESKNSITNMKTNFVKDITIKAVNEDNCFIAGMSVISEDEILCADYKNGSLKIFNPKDGTITSFLKTSSCPADVSTINSSCAATTLPNEGKILFLNTQSGLSISHSLNVREGCWGNDYHNGKMAVSFVNPSAVQVLDMEGHILHELMDSSILSRPERLALCNKSILVSDHFNNVVYEFSIDGQLKNTITSDDMKVPAGVTYTSCGSAVVCYAKKEKVGIIVPGTTKILPLKLQSAIMPYSIVIGHENRSLYISESDISPNCNLVKLYDLK